MILTVNWLAIIVASIINMGLGTAWYGPFFGKAWRQMTGMSVNPGDYTMNRGMYVSLGRGFALALVMNYIFAHVIAVAAVATRVSGAAVGISSGIIIWFGFVLVVTAAPYLWEGKPLKLWAIHAGYWLALLIINGALLGWWM